MGMIRTFRRLQRLCVTIVVLVTAMPPSGGTEVWAQEPAPPKAPLAAKQEMIRERFKRFEDRMFRVREKLELNEPDNAAKLERALKRAGELGLSDQLERLVMLLEDPSMLGAASAAQAEWLDQADLLLAILLERDANNEDRRNEIERLEEYRERVRELLQQQKGLRDASARASNRMRMENQLDQALERTEALLEKQTEQREADAGREQPTSEEKETSARAEEELSRAAAQLSEELRQLAESSPSEASDSPDQQQAREGAKESSEALKNSAESMRQARDAAKQGEREELEARQKRAEEELRRARDRLNEAREKLAPSGEAKEKAGEQRDAAEKTKGLSDQMKKDGEQKPQGSHGQQGGQQSPGQQSLDQAEQEMRDAAERLDEEKPEDATTEQDRALEQLEQAQKELEDELNQLRKEERAETLRNLEARFREMLGKQRDINAQTLTLDEFGKDRFRRAEQLQLADLSEKQKRLADDASGALHILDEEGTTIVFPRIVEQLAEDMTEVAGRLAASDTGSLTRNIEQQIIETLEELLAAVKKMQEENEQQQQNQQQGSPSDSQPLLPASAELKLLRASQLRVNVRTKAIEGARLEGSEAGESLVKSLKAAAERQRECNRIAEEMRDKGNVQ